MKKILHLLALVMIGYFSYAQSFGSVDNVFNPGSGFDDRVNDIEIQPDGKILIAGDFTSFNGNAVGQLVRLNSNGTHDNSLITSVIGQIYAVDIQNDGKIIIAGSFSHVNGTVARRVARLNLDGTLDNTFNTGSGSFSADIVDVEVLFDGSIVAVGTMDLFNDVDVSNIVKLNSDGSIALGSYGVNSPLRDIVVQPDGKILICGGFYQYNGTNIRNIARLNHNLSLDATLDPGTGAFDQTIYSMALQSDGKILIIGDFPTFNGISKKYIARLNSDGSVDNSFDAGTTMQVGGDKMILTENNKIIIGGQISNFNGTGINNIIVLNSDGSIDVTFNPGTGANGRVSALSLQNDGKILVGGNFTEYNGTSRTRITRINGEETTGLSQIDYSYQIQLYPNPASTAISVEMENASTLRMLDISGKLLKELNGASIYTIDVTDLTPGMYVIESAEGAKAKFIKE
jgi:uncharacterized delta-60 repeat protein